MTSPDFSSRRKQWLLQLQSKLCRAAEGHHLPSGFPRVLQRGASFSANVVE